MLNSSKEVSKKNGVHQTSGRRIVSTADLPKKSVTSKADPDNNKGPVQEIRTVQAIEVIDLAILETWRLPEYQRPLTVTPKVRALAEEIVRSKGEIPGPITIGVCNGIKYLLDGQHRCHSYRIAVDTLGMKDEGIVEVRYRHFEDESQMGPEFARLSTPLVRMKPDDFLKALEPSLPPIQYIRANAPFVGYGNVRRGKNPSTCISMSVVLRMWRGSATDTPVNFSMPAQDLARGFSMAEAKECVEFLNLCMEAWDRSPEYARLWSPLNMVLCAWLFRRVGSDKARKAANPNKWTIFSRDGFKECLMSLSAKPDYLQWLVGRTITEFDRGPCFEKIKKYMQARAAATITGTRKNRVKFPDPDWSSTSGRRR